MGKNISKNLNQNLSGKYSQKRFDHVKESVTDALKIVKKTIQKTTETTDDLIGNWNCQEYYQKISNSIDYHMKELRNSPQKNPETVQSKTELLKKIYIHPEKKSKLLMT